MKIKRTLLAFVLCSTLCSSPLFAAEDSNTLGIEAYVAFIKSVEKLWPLGRR